MNDDVRQLIQSVHDSPYRAIFASAGAGSQAMADLLAVAGASRTLLEALVPYSSAAFNDFLGHTPEQYVAESTARLMAGRAVARAHHLRSEPWPLLGLACTATIATDRAKKGDQRAHIAAWTGTQLIRQTIILDKGARDREAEEDVVSRLILNVLAQACRLADRVRIDLKPGDRMEVAFYDYQAPAEQLAEEVIPYFAIRADGGVSTDARPSAVLSGSFNPLHAGHIGLAATATAILGKPVAFEIPAANADKPRLPVPELLDRLTQFAGSYTVLASNAPTFVEKSRLFPGATFVAGQDTAARIVQPRFYGNSEQEMLAALAEIRSHGCSFLVAGREGSDGQFHTLADIDLPEGTADLFTAIPERQFRNDTSSTEIRAARNNL